MNLDNEAVNFTQNFVGKFYYNFYGTLKQKPKDEMQKIQRPHIIAEHQWYKKNNDTKWLVQHKKNNFVNHEPQILQVFYQHPKWFISL